MSVFVFKWCNFFAPTSEIYFTIWWKTLHHAKVAKTTVLYGFFGVFGSCSLSSYISIQTFYLLTFVWIKEKANAKGNGDWHLRKSRPQNVYEEILCFYIWVSPGEVLPGTFWFFCSCMWREDSKHAEVFSFPWVAGNLPRKGPVCVFLLRTVL